jgi:hypothetical protein
MSTQVQILVLAFEAALYPTLLAAVIVLLAQPRPKRMLGAYLGGGLIMSIGAGCLIVFTLGGQVNSESSARSYSLDFAIAGLLLLVAVVLSTRADVRLQERRRARKKVPPPTEDVSDKEPWSQRMLARGSLPLVFVAGILINVPGAAYLIALKDIAAANLSDAHAFMVIVEFNVIMFLLAEIPLVGLVVAPARTTVLVERFNGWLRSHNRQVAVSVCVAMAAFMVAKGIAAAS